MKTKYITGSGIDFPQKSHESSGSESSYIHADETCEVHNHENIDTKDRLPDGDGDVGADMSFNVEEKPDSAVIEIEAAMENVIEVSAQMTSSYEEISEDEMLIDVPDTITEETEPDEPDEIIIKKSNVEKIETEMNLNLNPEPLDTSSPTAPTTPTSPTGSGSDAADRLKEQLFSLISDFDDNDSTSTANPTPTITTSSYTDRSVEWGAERSDMGSYDTRISGKVDGLSDMCEDVNSSCVGVNTVPSNNEFTLPHINIVYSNNNNNDFSEGADGENDFSVLRHDTTRIPEESDDSDESGNLIGLTRETELPSLDNQALDASLVSSDLNLSATGRHMSEASEVVAGETLRAPESSVGSNLVSSPKPFDLLKDASAILNTSRDANEESSARSKRLSDRESLSEQRRKFILGESKPPSLDEEAAKNEDDAVFDTTTTVTSGDKMTGDESPEEIVAMLEHMAINAGIKIPKDGTTVGPNGTLKNDKTNGKTVVVVVEDSPDDVKFEANKNNGAETDSEENTNTGETEKTNKKRRKGELIFIIL